MINGDILILRMDKSQLFVKGMPQDLSDAIVKGLENEKK